VYVLSRSTVYATYGIKRHTNPHQKVWLKLLISRFAANDSHW